MTKSLLIVYHSQSGASARLSGAARDGAAREPAISTRLARAEDTGFAQLSAASGILLVCAENSGALSGGCKDFLDRIFYPAIARGLVRPYCLAISAGNDGRGAVAQAERILRGIPFTPAAEALILRGEPNERSMERVAELGQAFAAGLEMGIY